MGGPIITRRFFLIGGAAIAVGCSTNRSAQVDASMAADAAACPGQVYYPWFNAGPASSFATGVPVYFPSMENIGGSVYVVRDAGGLFAMSIGCTHDAIGTCIANGSVCTPNGGQFLCPSCGSQYALDGSVIAGPATKPLGHLEMCAASTVLVNLNVPADPAARLDA